jgi:hypothetical protein
MGPSDVQHGRGRQAFSLTLLLDASRICMRAERQASSCASAPQPGELNPTPAVILSLGPRLARRFPGRASRGHAGCVNSGNLWQHPTRSKADADTGGTVCVQRCDWTLHTTAMTCRIIANPVAPVKPPYFQRMFIPLSMRLVMSDLILVFVQAQQGAGNPSIVFSSCRRVG